MYSRSDAAIVRSWGGGPVLSPLTMHVPMIDKGEVEQWQASWGQEPVVLFAGQIRRDKRLDLLIEASAVWRSPARLAVIGQDAVMPLAAAVSPNASESPSTGPRNTSRSTHSLPQWRPPTSLSAHTRAGARAEYSLSPDSSARRRLQSRSAALVSSPRTRFRPNQTPRHSRRRSTPCSSGRRNTPVTQEKDAIAAHRHAYGLVSEPGDHT